MAEKKVLKAKDLEASGATVEKIEYAVRKFGNRVFKDIPLDEQPMAMDDQAGLHGVDFGAETEDLDSGEEHGVRLERFYGDDGELTGLKITCRCGEEIDLEFTREEDELPLEDSPEASADLLDTPTEHPPVETSGEATADLAPEPEAKSEEKTPEITGEENNPEPSAN